MSSLIDKIFKIVKPKKSHDDLFNFREISLHELDGYPNGINYMYGHQLDGFLIRNVLDEKEVNTILENHFKTFPKNKKVINGGISIYPEPFAQIHQSFGESKDLFQAYFLSNLKFWRGFKEDFGVDFENRLQTILGKMANGRSISPFRGVDEIGVYPPASFRVLNPAEKGFLNVHCGNYFHKEFPQFYSHIEKNMNVKDQLSYFVMLQDSEKGGELILYDIDWSDAEIRLDGGKIIKTKKGQLLELENPAKVNRQIVAPKPGDMIVFAGGRIWHKVQEVEGGRERITLGGFLSISHDGQSLYIWS
ncbi:MAG: 2OG-Fe(II) oxygenase [Saprospiraceae bacterium]